MSSVNARTGLVGLLLSGLCVASCLNTRNAPPLEPWWQVTFDEPFIYGEERRLTIFNGIVYCVTTTDDGQYTDAKLYAVDLSSGTVRWKANFSSRAIISSPQPLLVVKDSLVLFLTNAGGLRALNAETGAQQWEVAEVQKILSVSNGKVYVLQQAWNYGVLEAATGKVLKQTDLQGNAKSELVTDSGIEFFLREDSLEATDAANNAVLWQAAIPKSELASFQMLAANAILYISAAGQVKAVDGRTGDILWKRDHNGVPPVIERNLAYLGTSPGNGSIFELNARTGELIRTIPLDSGSGSDNDVVVDQGILYAMVFRSRTPRESPNTNVPRGHDPDPGRDYAVKAFDLSNVKLIATTKAVHGRYMTRPTPFAGMLCFGVANVEGTKGSRLQCFQLGTH